MFQILSNICSWDFLFQELVGIAYYILLENKKKKEMQKSEAKFWKNMK